MSWHLDRIQEAAIQQLTMCEHASIADLGGKRAWCTRCGAIRTAVGHWIVPALHVVVARPELAAADLVADAEEDEAVARMLELLGSR